MKIPLARPSINEDDIERAVGVLRSGMLVQGEQVNALELAVAELLGVEHAIALSNGTATLHLALLALGLEPGDEVIVPAFSYVATANVVEIVGAVPVFVDIELDSFNIDVAAIKGRIGPRTRALMPVHEFGRPADMTAIADLAADHGLPVIEDAACAIGARHRGAPVGGTGTLGSFSFHPRKSITSGEGGMLTTRDAELARRLRVLRNHGLEDGACVVAGYNYRMTDIQAALLIGQLQRLGAIRAQRAALAAVYDEALAGLPLLLPGRDPDDEVAWQSYHVVLDDPWDRAALFAFLSARGIGANYGAQCIPLQPHYQKKYGYGRGDFPNATRAFERGVVLPLYDRMTLGDARCVAAAVHEFFRRDCQT